MMLMSAFVYFQNTLNRLFTNCIKLSILDLEIQRRGGRIDLPPFLPERTTLQKPSLIRVKNNQLLLLLTQSRIGFISLDILKSACVKTLP